MAIKAVTFDAYGTLLRNEDLTLIPRRMVADHDLAARVEDVWRAWIDLYLEVTQTPPFRTLREIQAQILARVLRRLGVDADPAPYVDLFFRITTRAELYPEALDVLNALGPLPAAVLSNADHEHRVTWNFAWPVRLVVISEAVRAYKPNRLMFQAALEGLGLAPHEVLHVGDSEVDDIQGAKAAGLRAAWVNRSGQRRRADLPPADVEIRDLTGLFGTIL
jgi:2-haloalkanoic acid dehalogenase type II